MVLRVLLNISAAAAVATVAMATQSRAADIPAPVYRAPAPVTAVAAPSSWYGFYIGIHGGYGWGSNAINYAPNAGFPGLLVPGALPGSVAANPRGFMGGITYGSNYQFGSIVLGEESDLSYTDIKRSGTFGPSAATQITASQRMQYFSTTRVRAGFLVSEQWLLYGTAGLASAGVDSTSTFNLVAPGACAGAGNCPTGHRYRNLWGWTAGGGIEFATGPWSLRAEYLHYDLGNLNYNVTDPTLPGGVIAASTKFSGDIVRGGLAYRFNWTLMDLILGQR